MEEVIKRLNEIKQKSTRVNFPSEANLRFVSNHLSIYPVNGYLRMFLEIPVQERLLLRFARGSRIPMEKMPIANLRLLNKHRKLFPQNNSAIHEALLNREQPSRVQNRRNRLARLVAAERGKHEPFNAASLEKMSMNNLKFLNEHRNLFSTGKSSAPKRSANNITPGKIISTGMANRIHAEYIKRTKPLTREMKKGINELSHNWWLQLRAQELNKSAKTLESATKGNWKKAGRETKGVAAREGKANIRPPPNKSSLNWNQSKNNFQTSLRHKKINNANVQNVTKKLKAYRNARHPTETNMPNKPVLAKLTIENKRKYNQNMRQYNQNMRNWIIYMANVRRRNKT